MLCRLCALGIAISLAFPAQAAPTLHVSFDKGLDADKALGGKKAYQRNVQVVPGKMGKGVRMGKADQFLFYPAPKSLNLMKGTISMWVKPVGFSPSEAPDVVWEGYELFRVSSNRDEIRLEISRHGMDNNTNRCVQIQTCPVQPDGIGGSGQRIRAYGWIQRHMRKLQIPWPEGRFKHVAGTWDFEAGRLDVYIDGNQAASVQDGNLKKRWGKTPSSFQIGPYKGIKLPGGKGSDTKNVVLDEIRLFDYRLSPVEIAALAHGEASNEYDRKKDYRVPLVTIPPISSPPTIDGRMSAGEWNAAAGVGGFVDIGATNRNSGYVAGDDVLVKVAYDRANLYALFGTPLDKMPPAYTGGDDHYDPKLEMIEFWFAPEGERGDIFQFIGAPNGATYDSKNNGERWDCKWGYKNSLSDGRWIAEIQVAFSDLGVAPPKKGDEWRMNFCRFYAQEKRATCWSDTLTRYDVVSRFGRARFGDESAAVVTDVTQMLLGKIGWRYSMTNPSDTSMKVELDIQGRLRPIYQLDGVEGDGQTRHAIGDLFLHIRAAALKPGQTFARSIVDSFQKRGTRFYSLAAFRLPSRTPIFAQLIPISPAAGQMLFVHTAALYETRQVMVDVEAGPLRAQIEGDLTIKTVLKAGGKAFAATEQPLAKDQQIVGLKPAPWQAGEYTVEVSALEGGTVVARAAKPLAIKPKPVWWGNTIGMTDMVQPPWTPVRVKDRRVSVWGRDYDLARTGLPRQIITQKAPLLAGPIALRLGENGEDIREAVLTKKTLKATRAVHAVSGRLGPYKVTGNIEVTYDGVVEYDYTLDPTASGTEIPGLCLEIPVRKEIAEYLVRRAAGQGLIRNVSFRIGKDLVLPFNYSLWIGDIDHGLNWYTDTDEGWTAPHEKTVELKLLRDRALLRLHILGKGPATAVRLRFGLLATPFRPLKKGWRTTRLAGSHDFWTRGNLDLYDTAKLALFGKSPLDKKPNGEYYVSERDRRWLDRVIKHAHDRGSRFVLYTSGHGLAEQANAGVYQTYHTEWDMLPRGSYNSPPRRFFLVCPKSRHVDYFMWNLDRMIKAGKLDAVYFDQGTAGFCKNALHGCGYQDGAVRRRTGTVRAQREFYRRARQVFIDNGKEPLIIGHTSTQVIPANYTHLDALLNGEQFTGALVDGDYIKTIDEPMLRTQWSARLMGIPPIFLAETMWAEMKRNRWSSKDLFRKHLASARGVKATRNMMALLLPNDIIFYGGLLNIEIGERIWAVWDTLGQATYVSHRHKGLSTEPGPPRIQTGLYIKPNGEALLAVGNLEQNSTTVRVTIDAALYKLQGKQAVDMLDNKPTAVEDQTVQLDVGGKDFRLVLLKR